MTPVQSRADYNRITWLMHDENVFLSVKNFENRQDAPCRSLHLWILIPRAQKAQFDLVSEPYDPDRISRGFIFVSALWRSLIAGTSLQGAEYKNKM
jgi:hypothetical protein